ncbi:fatty acyl-AMP ligase [Streptomyces ipomoeae]|uniref:Putative long-chain-fatty-acid--CoA ligase n=1 Tax=Streptomyces ipomoeae 91-03 TaxID=698759 RepID=L1KPY1_9ACTN|nr:fatty acyl-AMP ligase [Streptomyces ipomoeae]EKX62836.1 putative long-chain-fatty-acid--CoA ligase [Streptomyces ipomoeae 91-03]MDX2698725.1 fatty acyl-AMP ligase [Streptomyces ipomoeae]MDX2826062.1 fatty acyl-AMP ligase [Streptomyces ipomoeae]MDX2844392.1 fatty acyl-AMP ligase [Streptomyces ipomoeae]
MDSRRPPSAPAFRSLPEYIRHWAETAPDRRAFTFVDHPAPHSRGVHRTLTWRRLDLRVRAVAARLAEMAEPGERVALLCPQGTEYVTAFLGALAAGLVAVPLYPPGPSGPPGHGDRLSAVLADADPTVVLTTGHSLDEVRELCASRAADEPPRPGASGDDRSAATAATRMRVVAVDHVPDAAADGWQPVVPDGTEIAYLQYTSGSTRVPAGVEISHANVVANARQALTTYGADVRPVTCVGWLPLYHDMGLVLSVAAPVVRGLPSVLMDPVAFLHEPVRWLRLLAAHPHAVSAAPNFAYDYCASTVTEAQKADLRLNGVTALINGSEPVRPGTADRFHAAFAAQGLAPDTHCPSYGLAEATVFVSAARPGEPLRRFALDRDALATGKALVARPDDPRAVLLAGCGTPAGQRVRIADPVSRTASAEGEVGEIWVQGPNVGRGYRNQDRQTRRVFGATFAEATTDPGAWLRTGDLGTVLDGQLIVTGRLKDLIVVDGRNHYPQDIEATAQDAHPAVRRDRLAAFGTPGAAGERVVVVAEHIRGAALADIDVPVLVRAVRAAVSARHGLRLADVVLVPPGTVPRTSSGKVSRALTRERYLAGAYAEGAKG